MSLIREATAGMQYLVRTNRFCMWAVRPGDRAARDAARREALSPVAGHLKDRLQPVAEHLRMGVKRRDPPDRPALAIIVECLGGDGNRLGTVGRAGGHREHQDFGAAAEERIRVALAHAIDIGLMAIVAADRHTRAKISRRADLAKEMVFTELTVRMAGDPPQEQLALDVAGAIESGRERPEPGGAHAWRRADRSSA